MSPTFSVSFALLLCSRVIFHDQSAELEQLASQRVESLSVGAVYLGGYWVNGCFSSRSVRHPLLTTQDPDFVRRLVARIEQNQYPFRELLIYHGRIGHITPLEIRVMLLEEPTHVEIERARSAALGSAHTCAGYQPPTTQATIAESESQDIIALIDGLWELAPQCLNHYNVSLGPYDVIGVNSVRPPHPLLGFGDKALPYLAAAVADQEYPVRELLLYHRIVGTVTPIETAISAFRLPSVRDVWYARMQVIATWRNSLGLQEARAQIRKYAACKSRPTHVGDETQILAAVRQIPTADIIADRTLAITIAGFHLGGPPTGQPNHPVLAFGERALPCISDEMKGVRPDSLLPFVLAVNAINRRVTRIEAELFLGNSPDMDIILQQASRIMYGFPDVRD
ncbi:MAG: hypothetical protein CHACPFDD_04194 [Phycisphaerae bacterium]|nr:hypothetical protein [Phycisphaerae bacterium]